jgi:hypothetical protein
MTVDTARGIWKAQEDKFIGASICLIPPMAWHDIFLGTGAKSGHSNPEWSVAVWYS